MLPANMETAKLRLLTKQFQRPHSGPEVFHLLPAKASPEFCASLQFKISKLT